MERRKWNWLTVCATNAAIFIFAFSALTAQTPPPPNNGNGAPSGGNIPVGGGAPIGGGLLILLTLGAAYGGKKVYEMKSKRLVE